MKILFRSFAYQIFQKENKVYFAERFYQSISLALLFFVLGCSFYFLKFLFESTSAMALFLHWGAFLILASTSVLVIITLFRMLKKPFIIDLKEKKIVLKNKIIPFSNIARLVLKDRELAGSFYVRIELESDSGSSFISPLLPVTAADTLRAVIQSINEKMGADLTIQYEPTPSGFKYFIPLTMIFIGIFWTVSAYYFIPDLIFAVSFGDVEGVLIWPFGIWIIILGIFNFLGLNIFPKDFAVSSLKEKLLMIAWVVSYLVLCYV